MYADINKTYHGVVHLDVADIARDADRMVDRIINSELC
jgi:hypothetical protein